MEVSHRECIHLTYLCLMAMQGLWWWVCCACGFCGTIGPMP